MEVKIFDKDSGCCAADCPFKKGRRCTKYKAELFGTDDNPTRCGKCHAEKEK